MKIFQTNSERDTREFAQALGKFLRVGDVVLLSGDLGTGKSVIARGIAAAHGVHTPMPSPSFPIMIPYDGTERVYHFDLYRLSDPDEFYAAGLDEFLGGDGISIVEWPEMGDVFPENAIRVTLNRGGDELSREIAIECPRFACAEAMLAALDHWRKSDEHIGD